MALVVCGHCSEIYRYNTEGDRNSGVNQVLFRMEWILVELQVETGIEKRKKRVLREDLHLRKIPSK